MRDEQARDEQARDEQAKGIAYKKLKRELRTNIEVRELVYLLLDSKDWQLSDAKIRQIARRLSDHVWENVINVGDDFIPVVDHDDPQVRKETLKLTLARLLRERRPVPRLLAKWGASYLDKAGEIDAEAIEIDPDEDGPLGANQTIPGVRNSTLLIYMMVCFGVRSEIAREAGINATANPDYSKYSVCNAVHSILEENDYDITYSGVVRCWQRGRKELA